MGWKDQVYTSQSISTYFCSFLRGGKSLPDFMGIRARRGPEKSPDLDARVSPGECLVKTCRTRCLVFSWWKPGIQAFTRKAPGKHPKSRRVQNDASLPNPRNLPGKSLSSSSQIDDRADVTSAEPGKRLAFSRRFPWQRLVFPWVNRRCLDLNFPP